jgi:hypothetical protein
MHFLNQLFSEKGTISSMRVMAMIALFAAIALAIMNRDIMMVSAFLAFSGGGKVASKFIETTNRPSETPPKT